MGVKGDFEYYEDDKGGIHKLKKLATERSPEFRDFPRIMTRKKLEDDFNDNFKNSDSYGRDKLLNGSKSKKTIKFNKKGFKWNNYNNNYKDLDKYI